MGFGRPKNSIFAVFSNKSRRQKSMMSWKAPRSPQEEEKTTVAKGFGCMGPRRSRDFPGESWAKLPARNSRSCCWRRSSSAASAVLVFGACVRALWQVFLEASLEPPSPTSSSSSAATVATLALALWTLLAGVYLVALLGFHVTLLALTQTTYEYLQGTGPRSSRRRSSASTPRTAPAAAASAPTTCCACGRRSATCLMAIGFALIVAQSKK